MLTRRECFAALPVLSMASISACPSSTIRLSTFSVDITCPIGHPCMGGGVAPAKLVGDPLFANGLILHGGLIGKPVVILALDWCELRNGAYDAWRTAIAKAVGTDPVRVMLSCLHQHDAPIADLEAEELLRKNRSEGSICDLKFLDDTIRRVAKDAETAMKKFSMVTHIGQGAAKVEAIASNRRYLDAQGRVRYDRTSATREATIRNAELGTIDPQLKLFSFWNGDKPLAGLSAYATHPMSYYGRGEVSADFIGMARRLLQADTPGTPQFYLSGCSGNVTAGKYNDGQTENRPILAQRLYKAMKAAWQATIRSELTEAKFRSVPLELEARSGVEFSTEGLTRRLRNDPRPFGQCLAALGLSWRQRVEAGRAIDLPVLDFGRQALVLVPAEAYVEFQLFAQQLRPKHFILTSGYGECGPGYIPIERAWREQDLNLNDWCWVNPGSEDRVKSSLRKALLG